jgi:dihydropteroate synthase
MGILNMTPDSFSDGGDYFTSDDAIRHAAGMLKEGADIIDVGGESTRPGSKSVPPWEQLNRIMSVIPRLIDLASSNEGNEPAINISLDTQSSEVAEQGLKLGVSIINDVSAGCSDFRMFPVVAHFDAYIVLMHMQGTPETMQVNPSYQNVTTEVVDFLCRRIDAAVSSGIKADRIILDPGIGFGKSRDHNLVLLANLDRIVSLGYPVVLGTSRKRFMGSLLKVEHPSELLGATAATTALGVAAGVRIFRVHDVKANRQAADLSMAILDQTFSDAPHAH